MHIAAGSVCNVRWLAATGSLAIFVLCSGLHCRGELLFERHQGGPFEYSEVGDIHTAYFDVTEPIRIQGITGWFDGGPVDVTVSVASPLYDQVFSGSFHINVRPVPQPGQYYAPGVWRGMGALNWDLEPGNYQLNFFDAGMPLSYGYSGPVADVPQFTDFANYWDVAGQEEYATADPFGVRIYGRPLSAVPEPSLYSTACALFLLAAVACKRSGLRRLFI
jgi:hypothetical protein